MAATVIDALNGAAVVLEQLVSQRLKESEAECETDPESPADSAWDDIRLELPGFAKAILSATNPRVGDIVALGKPLTKEAQQLTDREVPWRVEEVTDTGRVVVIPHVVDVRGDKASRADKAGLHLLQLMLGGLREVEMWQVREVISCAGPFEDQAGLLPPFAVYDWVFRNELRSLAISILRVSKTLARLKHETIDGSLAATPYVSDTSIQDIRNALKHLENGQNTIWFVKAAEGIRRHDYRTAVELMYCVIGTLPNLDADPHYLRRKGLCLSDLRYTHCPEPESTAIDLGEFNEQTLTFIAPNLIAIDGRPMTVEDILRGNMRERYTEGWGGAIEAYMEGLVRAVAAGYYSPQARTPANFDGAESNDQHDNHDVDYESEKGYAEFCQQDCTTHHVTVPNKGQSEGASILKINFSIGDRVKCNEKTFENFEGEVESIDPTSGRVTVMIDVYGRITPVELDYWQVDKV